MTPPEDGDDDSASASRTITMVTTQVASSRDASSSPHRKLHTKLVALSCIQDALQWAACSKDTHMPAPSVADPTPPEASRTADHIQVLITGSLHLVGGVIKVLDTKLALLDE